MKRQTITMSVKDARPEKNGDEERKYSFRTIAVDNIQENGNIRQVGDIDDLAASIRAHGIINPITVTNDFGMSTQYRVVAGHRRLAAAKRIGLAKVPCHVVDKDSEGLDEIPLSENITRMDMTPYEECLAVKFLVSKKNTVQQVARKFGRTLRWVLVRKKLADAGDKVLKKVKEGVIGLDAAAKIADLPDNVFKRELESCYRTDKYFIDGVLDRYHKDLSHAPFEHEACLKCDNCSSCQADLFENEPKAYCLDPNCWARKAKKAAEAKVKKLQEEGRNARLGKFSSYGVDCMDEADKFEIGKYDSKGQEQAKEAGIQKRILVDAATLKTYEYFDKRDLPDYHEMTEEEREAEEEKERKEFRFRETKQDMTKIRLRKAIARKIQKGDKDDVIALLLFRCYDLDDTIDESQHDLLGIKTDEDRCAGLSDIDDQVRPCDIHDAVLGSVEHILERTYDIDILRKMYSIITYGDPKEAEPVDDEVEDELSRKNAESEHDEEEEDADE
ncbi:ParB/RepB/Spo0J family partition protein [Fibrobacter sp. UWCM]|uniref:ParB/RepB/Spo0J family partition protein n=1 Tax=Fibrobacter sp. UWCM TaxID=1896208 RepID=UPI00091AF491|nr:ParB/RepB/Spo0J family partition protein [Fibrobacter sp. UWCM]SHH90172.1 ParB/RepB/Spo0J family partition protein [Fibrobacter sp. UWCM]